MMFPPRVYVFVGLNILRALSIIGLILVFASSIFTLTHDVEAVKAFETAEAAGNSDLKDCDYVYGSTVPNQAAGTFWAILNRLLIMFEVIVLTLSEFGWPAKFFDTWFPILGRDFGLGPLGIMQCLIGAAVLSHHVDDFSLVSAFFLFAVGCLNILFGLIFRASAKPRRSTTNWRERSKDVLPTNVAGVPTAPVVDRLANRFWGPSDQNQNEKTNGPKPKKAGYGFGRQGEKKAGLKGFLISKPIATAPKFSPSR